MVVAAAQAPAVADAPEPGSSFGSMLFSGIRMMALYAVMSYAARMFMGSMSPSTAPSKGGVGGANHVNHWRPSTPYQISVVFTDNVAGRHDVSDPDAIASWSSPETFTYDWASDHTIKHDFNISLPESVWRHNASVFAHVTLRPSRRSDNGRVARSIQAIQPVILYRPRQKVNTKVNLVSGVFSDSGLDAAIKSGETESIESYRQARDADTTWEAFWRPELVIRPVIDQSTFAMNTIPLPLAPYYHFDPVTHEYLPPIYFDYFWLLSERFIALNETVKEVPLSVSISPISMMKWQLQVQMEASFVQQQQYGSTEQDTEGIRKMFLETNPILLGITFLVSVLHMVFDFLAFKNDIAFWKQDNKSMEGLSIRTILINSVCQLVIFLYLLDNDTSWMILFSAGIGVLIEFWKVTKTLDIKVTKVEGRIFPQFDFKDKQSYSESETAKHEKQAMRYLSWVCYPLSICYALYSLAYHEHRSVYSWILGAASSFVYLFGFILMCPQLYLNYKLKSVAHLPWRMLTYKALNTFVDDLFAFIITMPLMHRLACFRDDIVFFVYIYQRWIYRVDFTRTNEFGLRPDDENARTLADDQTSRTVTDDESARMLTDAGESKEEDEPELDVSSKTTSTESTTLRARRAVTTAE